MSDGPHRSLPLRKGWKNFAEFAAKNAYAPLDVEQALYTALAQDWRKDIGGQTLLKLREILNDPSLFAVFKSEQLNALRQEVSGFNLGTSLIDCVGYALSEGFSGDAALIEASKNALLDRAYSSAKAVEEHYYREASDRSARFVRDRLEGAVSSCNVSQLVNELIKTKPNAEIFRIKKQTGLDVGPSL